MKIRALRSSVRVLIMASRAGKRTPTPERSTLSDCAAICGFWRLSLLPPIRRFGGALPPHCEPDVRELEEKPPEGLVFEDAFNCA